MSEEGREPILDTLGYIDKFIKSNGWAPTIRQVAAGLDISSTSVVSYRINRLASLNFIVKKDNQARAIKLTPAGKAFLEANGRLESDTSN